MPENDENSQSTSEPKSRSKKPVIVTIGASAGGVTALQRFFEAIPEQTGAVFVVVVHLDPEHRSELPQILAGRTHMPVTQVNRTEKIGGGSRLCHSARSSRSAGRSQDFRNGIRGAARKAGPD